MTTGFPLALLDVEGRVEDTIELAPFAEALGYTRYWIAEHQPQPTPILISAIIAGLTERIRVGTAGILFHYYPPKRTAHDFHFLERAFEGRIDAGFCGAFDPAIPTDELERDPRTYLATYAERVGRLVRYLRNTPASPSYDNKTAWRGALDEPPQIWSLGGGMRSAELAARNGVCLGYSLLYASSVDDPAAVEHYRNNFVAARDGDTARVAVAVCGVCCETTAEAAAIVAATPYTFFKPTVVGDAAECGRALRALKDRYAADDVVFADLCIGIEARKRCYELLAGELLTAGA